MLPNGDLWLQLDISYWGKGVNEKLLQSFKYEFKPSVKIKDALFLNIGLIGNETQNVSVELIDPPISD